MSDLEAEIKAFERFRSGLEADHRGEWALVHGEDLIATFVSFDEAATEGVKRFGRGPFLIRQIGATPVILPASVMYTFSNA